MGTSNKNKKLNRGTKLKNTKIENMKKTPTTQQEEDPIQREGRWQTSHSKGINFRLLAWHLGPKASSIPSSQF